MKINIKKIVAGTVAVAVVGTVLFTSVLAAEKTNDNKPFGEFKGPKFGMHKMGRPGFFNKGEMKMPELTEEQKAEMEAKMAEMKEKFGERKELTEEEKAAKKAEMEAKAAERKAEQEAKKAERDAKLKEKLEKGEITQEQYDKMLEKKPGKGFGRPNGKGFGKGVHNGFGRGFGKGPKGEFPKTEETK